MKQGSSAHTLEKSIRAHLAPLLREEGFLGSGRIFRRFVGGLAHVVQVQGWRYGGAFAVNLGVQPMNVAMRFCSDARKMGEADCEFRKRLSVCGDDQWWSYGPDQASMDAAVIDAASAYISVGRPAFTSISAADSPLHTLTAQRLHAGDHNLCGFWITDVRAAYVLARMRREAGDTKAAGDFARFALREIGDGFGGAGLISELQTIAEAGFKS